MRVLPALILLILVAGSSAGAQPASDPRYSNEEFGFSFEYPGRSDLRIVEGDPDPKNHLLFVVALEDPVSPFLRVSVFTNPEGLDLPEYAYRWVFTHKPEEIGMEHILPQILYSFRFRTPE